MYKGIIYCATSPSNKKYYGKSCQSMAIRKRNHIRTANDLSKHSRFASALRKYGYESFTWEIVEELHSETREELRSLLNEREKHWILVNNTENKEFGYNMTSGGDGGPVFGRTLSEETRQKISSSLKGHTLSEDTKIKISNKQKGVPKPKPNSFVPWCKGKTLSDETKKKISDKRKGIKFSDATLEKMRNSAKGRVPWNKGLKKNKDEEGTI